MNDNEIMTFNFKMTGNRGDDSPDSPCTRQSCRWWRRSRCTGRWAAWQPAGFHNKIGLGMSRWRSKMSSWSSASLLTAAIDKPTSHGPNRMNLRVEYRLSGEQRIVLYSLVDNLKRADWLNFSCTAAECDALSSHPGSWNSNQAGPSPHDIWHQQSLPGRPCRWR